MEFDIHPLSDYLSTSLDFFLEKTGNDRKNSPHEIEDNFFDIDNIVPPDNNNDDDSGQIVKSAENSPVAFKLIVSKVPSTLSKNRSYIYQTMYNNYIPSVDIGSGNFSKGLEHFNCTSRYNGPNRLLLDNVDREIFPYYVDKSSFEDFKVNYRKFDMNDKADQKFLCEFLKNNPDYLITATNSLMHKAEDLSPYDQFDMLYTLPNPHEMIKQGCIAMIGERKYRFAVTGDEEYAHGEKLDSEPGELQSLAINLSPRVIEVKKVKKKTEVMEKRHLLFDLNRRPHRLSQEKRGEFIGPFYKKIDGVTMIISRRGDKLYAKTSRSFDIYNVVKQSGTGPFDDFEIEGEFIENARVFIIHTVYTLGEVSVPAFMKKVEKEFVEKYLIEGLSFGIYFKKKYDTIDHCLTDPEIFGGYKVTQAEGVLGFVVGKRHMVAGKVMESLDITAKTARMLERTFRENYDQEIHVTNLTGGICEYVILRQEEIIYLKAIKERKDKNKENNYDQCCLMIMNTMFNRNHELVDYISDEVLVKYGIVYRNSNKINNN